MINLGKSESHGPGIWGKEIGKDDDVCRMRESSGLSWYQTDTSVRSGVGKVYKSG